MDNSKNRHNDHLGVNKMGKNIRKSPLHQPDFSNNNNSNTSNNNNNTISNNNQTRQQPQPQVYNISKNDFRNIVQKLTGSPAPEPLPRPPPQNPPKPQSIRLQKIRPPPLIPINRPPLVPPAPAPAAPPPAQFNAFFRHLPGPFGQLPSPIPMQPFTPGDAAWPNTAESPITAYMNYLLNPSPRGFQGQPMPHLQQHPLAPAGPPAFTGPPPMPNLPVPQMGGPPPPAHAPPLLPSPTSQFLLPSPNGYFGLLSPRSPYPLLSPGLQFPPLTPNFGFGPMGQSGILGPGPQPPLSPGLVFPLSPSGFFPISSPRWRGQ